MYHLLLLRQTLLAWNELKIEFKKLSNIFQSYKITLIEDLDNQIKI